MGRRFEGERLIVATHNAGKVREIGALVAGLGIAAVAAGDLGLPEPEETGDTFIANAALKALAAATAADAPALADDSGLCVDGLDGDPGLYSARWAGPTKDFRIAMQAVEDALAVRGPAAARTCRFVCALALAWPDGHVETFEGRIEGRWTWPPRGERGFGYDPAFTPDGFAQTFGEIDPAAKHAMSHRARAFALLLEACFP
jgi:XTP/dITP diphosphohydrolase